MEEQQEDPEHQRRPRVNLAVDDATAAAWTSSSTESRSWRIGVAEFLHKIHGVLDARIASPRNPMERLVDRQHRPPIVIAQVQATAHQTLMLARSCR